MARSSRSASTPWSSQTGPEAVSEVLTGRITNGLAVAGLLAAAAGTDAAPAWIRPADAPWPGPAQ